MKWGISKQLSTVIHHKILQINNCLMVKKAIQKSQTVLQSRDVKTFLGGLWLWAPKIARKSIFLNEIPVDSYLYFAKYILITSIQKLTAYTYIQLLP